MLPASPLHTIGIPNPSKNDRNVLLEQAREIIRTADAAYRDTAGIGNRMGVSSPSLQFGYGQPQFRIELSYAGREKLARKRTDEEKMSLVNFALALQRAGRAIDVYVGVSTEWQRLEFEEEEYKVTFVN